MLASFVEASRARDPTLRSRLYDQLRCGNGICDIVENAKTCPQDCPGEPAVEAKNETPTAPPVVEETEPSRPRGFEHISSVIPSEELFDQTKPKQPEPQQQASTTTPLAQPTPFPPQSSSTSATSEFTGPLVILLLILLAGIILYEARVHFDTLRVWYCKLTGKDPGIQHHIPEGVDKTFHHTHGDNFDIPHPPGHIWHMITKNHELMVIKKDAFTERFKKLLKKVKKTPKQLQKQQGIPPMPSKNAVPAPIKQSTILTKLITDFKQKGLGVEEIKSRIQRMGLWDDATIQHHLA